MGDLVWTYKQAYEACAFNQHAFMSPIIKQLKMKINKACMH